MGGRGVGEDVSVFHGVDYPLQVDDIHQPAVRMSVSCDNACSVPLCGSALTSSALVSNGINMLESGVSTLTTTPSSSTGACCASRRASGVVLGRRHDTHQHVQEVDAAVVGGEVLGELVPSALWCWSQRGR